MSEREYIPKIIHYCWFGRKEKPETIKKCFNSWKNVLRDYRIIEWNEDNFNINSNRYVKEAYEAKKYAFVSDYVRVYALYNFGGVYLDTDVEVLNCFDSYLNNNSFFGFEAGNLICTSTIGARKKNKLIKQILNYYNNKKFINDDGSYNMEVNVQIVTGILNDSGVKLNGKFQIINNLSTIYPMEVFSPYDYRYFKDMRTSNTVAIHYYNMSWMPKRIIIKQKIKKVIVNILGIRNYKRIIDK